MGSSEMHKRIMFYSWDWSEPCHVDFFQYAATSTVYVSHSRQEPRQPTQSSYI